MAKVIAYIGFNPLPQETLGQRIRAKRLELGLYQRELAERFGVNITTLRQWELDQMQPEKHQTEVREILERTEEAD